MAQSSAKTVYQRVRKAGWFTLMLGGLDWFARYETAKELVARALGYRVAFVLSNAWLSPIILVIGFVLVFATRPPGTKKQMTLTPPVENEPRIFVSDTVTPAYLCGLYRQHTDVQANQLIPVFLNKWIKVSGDVLNVSHNKFMGEEHMVVTLRGNPRQTLPLTLSLTFEIKWKEKLSTMRQDDNIVVIGQIEDVNPITLSLTNCELLDSCR